MEAGLTGFSVVGGRSVHFLLKVGYGMLFMIAVWRSPGIGSGRNGRCLHILEVLALRDEGLQKPKGRPFEVTRA